MKVYARALSMAAALGAGFVLAAPPAAAGEVAGVKLEETLTAGGKTLKLNGMGLRKKAIFKVYVAGLYLETASKDGAAVASADAPKAIKMHFLRSVDKGKLVETYKEGFDANAKEKAAAQKPALDQFFGTVADVKDGTVVTYTYLPGTGTVVTRDGKDVGTIAGKEFAETLFLLWFGPKPPSEDLKKALLGN